MAYEIRMPKLSSTMKSGTILQWFKNEGEHVEIGEPLFEIMTDKINIEVESYDEGILLRKYFEPDDEIPVNHIIGYIGSEGENVPEVSPGIGSDEITENKQQQEKPVMTQKQTIEIGKEKTGEKVRATPAARRLARENQVDLQMIQGSGPKGRIQKKDVTTCITKPRKKVTPLAQKIAAAKHIDLETVEGSGAGGKIKKKDVFNAIDRRAEKVQPPLEKRRLSGIRKFIAEHMQMSVTTAPHVTLTTEVDMTRAKEMRKQLLPIIEKQTGFRLSYTEIILLAAAKTLIVHPAVNVSLYGDNIVYHKDAHIGIAAATEKGLIVPVIKNVNEKGLAQLTNEMKSLIQLAKNQQLAPEQLQESTFTVTNLGMYDVDIFTPIINQPNSAILGIGKIANKPAVIEDTIEIRPLMWASLSFDHRVMDGAHAAAFLTDLKRMLENPFELMI